ncbi:MAG TPA: MFS transporter, partial [Pirellulaceae bacterium]|nr:MFS transporter [Pirellulaceae bacterium]
AGALTGVLIAAWLLWWLTGSPTSEAESAQADVPHSVPAWVYRVVIAVSAVLGLGSWLLTWLVRDVSEQHREAERVLDGQVEPEVESLSADRAAARLFRPGWLGLPGRYWLALAALALFALANSSDAFLLLRASEAGFSPWAIVMIYATFNVSYALFSYPAGAWSDRIGRWRFIGAGWVLYILVYVGMALLTVDTRDWVWVLMGIYGLYMALTWGWGKR